MKLGILGNSRDKRIKMIRVWMAGCCYTRFISGRFGYKGLIINKALYKFIYLLYFFIVKPPPGGLLHPLSDILDPPCSELARSRRRRRRNYVAMSPFCWRAYIELLERDKLWRRPAEIDRILMRQRSLLVALAETIQLVRSSAKIITE